MIIREPVVMGGTADWAGVWDETWRLIQWCGADCLRLEYAAMRGLIPGCEAGELSDRFFVHHVDPSISLATGARPERVGGNPERQWMAWSSGAVASQAATQGPGL